MSGRACSINGATQVRAGAVRPEIIVPRGDEAAAGSSPGQGDTGLNVGTRIRLIRVPYFGMFATVVALPHEPRKIETGAWTRVLEAKLDAGPTVTVPRANVERA
jgi:hypothetical protein